MIADNIFSEEREVERTIILLSPRKNRRTNNHRRRD